MRCYVRRGSTSFNSAMFCYLRRTRGLNNITACWKSQPWVSTLAWYSLFKRFHVQRLAYRVTVTKLSVALLLLKYQGSTVASQSLWTSMFVPTFFGGGGGIQSVAVRLHSWCIDFNYPAVVQAILSSVKLCLSLNEVDCFSALWNETLLH
jgi:hypothetical protein